MRSGQGTCGSSVRFQRTGIAERGCPLHHPGLFGRDGRSQGEKRCRYSHFEKCSHDNRTISIILCLFGNFCSRPICPLVVSVFCFSLHTHPILSSNNVPHLEPAVYVLRVRRHISTRWSRNHRWQKSHHRNVGFCSAQKTLPHLALVTVLATVSYKEKLPEPGRIYWNDYRPNSSCWWDTTTTRKTSAQLWKRKDVNVNRAC